MSSGTPSQGEDQQFPAPIPQPRANLGTALTQEARHGAQANAFGALALTGQPGFGALSTHSAQEAKHFHESRKFQHWLKVFNSDDNLPADQQALYNPLRERAIDADAFGKKTSNIAYWSQQMGLDPREAAKQWSTLRPRIAKQLKVGDSDGEIFASVAESLNARKDRQQTARHLASQAWADAMTGNSDSPSF